MRDTPAEPPRNIILLSDGTGNSAASLFKTNVRRLYDALDLADPADPEQPRQFAFYDDGVGTSGFRPLAQAGGAFGYGLARNVRELYAALCRTYRPGDRIHAFGFSRGAFTIRILIGLIVTQGIIPYRGNDAALDRAVRAAYRDYRRERHARGQALLALRAPRDRLLRWWHARTPIEGQPPYDRSANHHPERIEFVGVWDTVDAYGLPIEELTRAIDRYILPLNMANADLSPKVWRARQALALDEERQTFHPRLWNEATPDAAADPERIRQVWFAGVHADVGGGYPEDGLAHVSLDWMLSELAAAAPGLRLKPGARARIREQADENAPIHDSRRGLASYYRYRPRDLEVLRDQEPRSGANFAVRINRPLLHESVLRRIRAGQDGYAPISATLDFDVALIAGGTQPAATHLGPRADPAAFAAVREASFNLVWWRRVAYFLTLGFTLALLSLPAWRAAEGCSSWACFLSPLILALGGLLPGLLSGWTAAAAAHPLTLLILLALVLAGTLAGSRLSGRIQDEMRLGWYQASGLPAPVEGMARPRPPGPVNRAVQRLRTHPRYIGFWNVARRHALPAVAGIVTLYLGLALLNLAIMSAAESAGAICRRGPAGAPFATADLCAATGEELEAGARYEILLRIPEGAPWRDASLPATPQGVAAPSALMALATPLRRHWGQPWFRLMARIGEQGTDTQAPDWRLISTERGQLYRAELTAARAGPLFLYVNDAMPALFPPFFYANNRGTAEVSVNLLSRAVPPQSSLSTSPAR